MGHFTTRQVFFLYSCSVDVQEQAKLDLFLTVLERSGVADVLDRVNPDDVIKCGRRKMNKYDLFATTLYGFAFDSGTLRNLESSCKYDLRYIYLMRGEQPTYVTFCNFINEYIVPNQEEIFSCVVKAILNECGIQIDDVYVDGTKIEADANKYKFVWKPTTFHKRLCEKVRNLLKLNGLDQNIPDDDIFSSDIIAQKVTEFSQYLHQYQGNDIRAKKKQYEQLENYLERSLDYEEKERICGPDRNSYYKTDHDATAMTLKTDYYAGLASNMHAAYNCQAAVCKGFVCAYYVSQSRNDIKDFIPTLENFYRIFQIYPINVCADAGYGSSDNYRYLHDHGIGNYVKHQSWEGNASGKNPSQYRLNGDGTIICLNGKIGKESKVEGRHPKKAGNKFFKITGCKTCPFRKYCKRYQKNKSENFKIFEVDIEMTKFKQEAEVNLLSPKGIEIRVNRSCQMEGSFGILKQDMRYTRFRRISLPKVTCEYMFTFLGRDVRKLFSYFSGDLKIDYWQAPDDLQSETFKKPSAKRLTNKMNKKNNKSKNQEAKSSYKYKKKGAA